MSKSKIEQQNQAQKSLEKAVENSDKGNNKETKNGN